tara:strand:+ start:4127 stop:4510 length:384 start_codon:yes stop_codon:yes gene_type:complete
MNLKLIENKTIRRGEREVSISKSGVFSFSLTATLDLKLNNDAQVCFFQNEEDPTSWYVQVTTKQAKQGVKIRIHNKSAKANAVFIAKSIANSTQNDSDKTFKALIGNEIDFKGIPIYPLLIKKASNV